MIEAANIIDERNEDFLATKLPNVYSIWKLQQSTRKLRKSSQIFSPKPHFSLSGMNCLSTSYNNTVGVQVRVYPSSDNSSSNSKGYEIWLPLRSSADYDEMYERLSSVLEIANSAKISEVDKSLENYLPSNINGSSNRDIGIQEKLSSHKIIIDDKDVRKYDNNTSRTDNEMIVPPAQNGRNKWMVVFTLKGESKMGMPWTPLWLLCRYMLSACGQKQGNKSQFLEINIKYLNPNDLNNNSHKYSYLTGISRSMNQCRQGPPSIPYNSIKSNTNINGTVYSNICTVIDSMRTYGYAVISVDDIAARTVSKAYEALLRFYTIPVKEKRKTFKRFDGDRYVGWTRDRAREWIQMRMGNENNDGMLWPEGCTSDDRESMVAAVKYLTLAAEEIFEEICVSIGLGSRKYLQSLIRPKPQRLEGESIRVEQGIHMNRSPSSSKSTGRSPSSSKPAGELSTEEEAISLNRSSSLGSSVCRMFVYLDREEGLNIDRNVSRTPPLKQHFMPAAASGIHFYTRMFTFNYHLHYVQFVITMGNLSL
jgi:hypothetical protein